MHRLLIVALLFVSLTGQQKRFPYRASAGGGGGSGTTYATCTPTSTQLARRTSITSLETIAAPSLPAVGGGFCDPAYGNWVARVDDDVSAVDQIDIPGKAFFNINNTKVVTSVDSGALRVYDLNTTTMTVSGGVTLVPETAGGSSVSPNLPSCWWDYTNHVDAPNTLFCFNTMKIYLINVVPNGLGKNLATLIVDMESEYPGGLLWKAFPARNTLRVLGTVQDPAHSYARLAYYVIDITNRTPSGSPTANYTIVKKFKNGVDSANWYTFQRFGSLVNGSNFNEGPINGYKSSLDASGNWLVHILLDDSTCPPGIPTSPCGSHVVAGGPYNTILAEHVTTGQLKYMQGNGHSALGYEEMATLNSSGYSTCLLRPKVHTFATLTSDPGYTVAANEGKCFLPSLAPQNITWWGIQYNNMFAVGRVAAHIIMCYETGPCPTPTLPLRDEVFTVDHTSTHESDGGVNRRVKLYHVRGSSVNEYNQVVQSYDGKMIAYQSNMGTSEPHVFIVRIAP